MTSVVTWRPGLATLGRSVVAMGMFDGVHLGHQALLADTAALAESEGAAATVLTFDRDPEAVLHPKSPPGRLLDRGDRLGLIGAQGIAYILEVPFDKTVAGLSANAFLDGILDDAFDISAVVIGSDFQFGAGAEGDVSTIRTHGSRAGYRVFPRELVVADGEPVTSTRIRDLLIAGRVGEAATLLGREHRLHGTVVPGRGIGRTLGVPTANLSWEPSAVVPADGVYAAYAETAGERSPAAVSIGRAPTFPIAERTVEAHLLETDEDLTGTRLTLHFVERLRDQKAFASADELATAISADLDRVARLFSP